MSCNLTQGRKLTGCYTNHGGIKKVYVANHDEVDSITVDQTSGKVTDITMDGSALFYEFDLHEKASTDEFSEELNFEINNAAKSYTQTLTLLFNKTAQDEQEILKTLALTNTMLVIRDNNGIDWLLGKDRGAHLDSAEHGSGTGLTERNGTTLTFQAEEKYPMFVVDTSAFDFDTITSY